MDENEFYYLQLTITYKFDTNARLLAKQLLLQKPLFCEKRYMKETFFEM